MDNNLIKPTGNYDLTGTICVVTGANSGIGYAVSEKLMGYGATVVMACENLDACKLAADKIAQGSKNGTLGQLDPMLLDLADLDSVKQFTVNFREKYSRLDILVNNAGLMAPPGARTAQGYEASFGIMHLGHAALTRWLADLMIRPVSSDIMNSLSIPVASRIVFVGSLTFAMGSFDESFLSYDGTGDLSGEITDNCGHSAMGMECCPLLACPYTNGYSRAKLSNILYTFSLQQKIDAQAVALQKKKPQRRVVASVVHPGTVSTSIHPFLSSPAVSWLLRSPEQASYVVLNAILHDTFIPGSYIDSMNHPHDFFQLQQDYLPIHLSANPSALNLPFASVVNEFSMSHLAIEQWFWNRMHWISSPISKSSEVVQPSAKEMASRLWEVTEGLLHQYEQTKTK